MQRLLQYMSLSQYQLIWSLLYQQAFYHAQFASSVLHIDRKHKSFPLAAVSSAVKTRAAGHVPGIENEKLLSAGTEMLARTQEAFSALGPLVMKENLVLAFEVTLS